MLEFDDIDEGVHRGTWPAMVQAARAVAAGARSIHPDAVMLVLRPGPVPT